MGDNIRKAYSEVSKILELLGAEYINKIPNEIIENINKESFALVIGNEGNGIKKEISALCDSKVHIKTSKVESLNVAIATSIMLYEINKE